MTRMWMVDPSIMCRNHLLGEHKEIHQLVGSILAGRSVAGHAERGQIEASRIRSRHRELAAEMAARGYSHQSPLPDFPRTRAGKVDRKAAAAELFRRCAGCRRMKKGAEK